MEYKNYFEMHPVYQRVAIDRNCRREINGERDGLLRAAKLTENKEIEMKFVFGDSLNRLDVAYSLLVASYSAYGGGVKATIETEDSSGKPATVKVESECHRGWRGACNGPEGWYATGKIEWHTSGGHVVIFLFEKQDGEPVALRKVQLGPDKSTYLYPSIKERCLEMGVQVEIIPQQ